MRFFLYLISGQPQTSIWLKSGSRRCHYYYFVIVVVVVAAVALLLELRRQLCCSFEFSASIELKLRLVLWPKQKHAILNAGDRLEPRIHVHTQAPLFKHLQGMSAVNRHWLIAIKRLANNSQVFINRKSKTSCRTFNN